MKNRIYLWDNIKFILITLMVVGHLIDEFTSQSVIYRSVFLFIYSFHMPLFIFISGLFHSNKNVKNKFMFYISVGFLYKISTVIFDRISGNITPSFSLLSDGGPSWFMFVIATYTFIMYVLRNFNLKYLLVFSIVLSCFTGYDTSIGDFLYLSRSIVFFPFYILGCLTSTDNVLYKKRQNSYMYMSLIIIAIYLLMCFYKVEFLYKLRYLFTGRNPFYSEIMKYAPIVRLLCYFISFILGLSIVTIIPNKKIAYITEMGEYSLNTYFWHWKVYLILDYLFGISRIFLLGYLGKLVFIFIAILISLILSRDGIFSFPMKQIKIYCFKNSGEK